MGLHNLSGKDTRRKLHSGQSTPSGMSKCLASSGQHLVNVEGSSRPSSGSSRMVPTLHFQRIIGMATATFPWPTDQPKVWPWVGAAFTGLKRPRFLSMWIPWGQDVWLQAPDHPDLEEAITAAIRAITREECWRVVENFASRIQGCQFWNASETKGFCGTDLKVWGYLLHRLVRMWLKFRVDMTEIVEVIRLFMLNFFVSPCMSSIMYFWAILPYR